MHTILILDYMLINTEKTTIGIDNSRLEEFPTTIWGPSNQRPGALISQLMPGD
jgi:hypothetical protein